MSSAQPDEQMDMIFDATHGLGDTSQGPYVAAQPGVQAVPPLPLDQGPAFLGAEDEMILKTPMTHGAGDLLRCRWIASTPAAPADVGGAFPGMVRIWDSDGPP